MRKAGFESGPHVKPLFTQFSVHFVGEQLESALSHACMLALSYLSFICKAPVNDNKLRALEMNTWKSLLMLRVKYKSHLGSNALESFSLEQDSSQ